MEGNSQTENGNNNIINKKIKAKSKKKGRSNAMIYHRNLFLVLDADSETIFISHIGKP
jgi:hypothetical protein